MSQKINHKSDFDFILSLATCVKRGEDGPCEKMPVGWPGFDWSATFWTSNRANTYVASRHGDNLVNCFEDNGEIHIVVNNHRLGKGVLWVEFHSELPNAIYPDAVQDLYEPQSLGIELVDGAGDCQSKMHAELLLPYVNGGAQAKAAIPQSILPLVSGIKRRVISTGAQPGIVYRNYYNLIRLITEDAEGEGYNCVADLNGLYYRRLHDSYPLGTMSKFYFMESGVLRRLNKTEPISLGNGLYGFDRPGNSNVVPVVKLNLNDGTFITKRRDDKGRMVFTAFKGAEYERPLAPPRISKLAVRPYQSGGDRFWRLMDFEGKIHLQTWRRGGQLERYKWRNAAENSSRKNKNVFRAAIKQRTVFARIRRVVGNAKSEWVYLRLHRGESKPTEWRIYYVPTTT